MEMQSHMTSFSWYIYVSWEEWYWPLEIEKSHAECYQSAMVEECGGEGC